MQKLCQYVVNNVASKWEFIGYALINERHSSQIKTIKSNYKDSEQCCMEMFSHWLTTHPNANWYDLVKALKIASLEYIAADLEKMFVGTYVCLAYIL